MAEDHEIEEVDFTHAPRYFLNDTSGNFEHEPTQSWEHGMLSGSDIEEAPLIDRLEQVIGAIAVEGQNRIQAIYQGVLGVYGMYYSPIYGLNSQEMAKSLCWQWDRTSAVRTVLDEEPEFPTWSWARFFPTVKLVREEGSLRENCLTWTANDEQYNTKELTDEFGVSVQYLDQFGDRIIGVEAKSWRIPRKTTIVLVEYGKYRVTCNIPRLGDVTVVFDSMAPTKEQFRDMLGRLYVVHLLSRDDIVPRCLQKVQAGVLVLQAPRSPHGHAVFGHRIGYVECTRTFSENREMCLYARKKLKVRPRYRAELAKLARRRSLALESMTRLKAARQKFRPRFKYHRRIGEIVSRQIGGLSSHLRFIVKPGPRRKGYQRVERASFDLFARVNQVGNVARMMRAVRCRFGSGKFEQKDRRNWHCAVRVIRNGQLLGAYQFRRVFGPDAFKERAFVLS